MPLARMDRAHARGGTRENDGLETGMMGGCGRDSSVGMAMGVNLRCAAEDSMSCFGCE